MRKTPLIIVAFAAFFACHLFGAQMKLDISWSLDPKAGIYTNNQTKISFPKTIASFTQQRATPANEDGSASFAYSNKQGIITIYLTHRLILGLPGSDDCTAKFREVFVGSMREAHGKTDSESMFKFSHDHDGKKLAGLGMTAHFVSSPALGGPVYSEFGAVLVGDFIYYYRATFPKKDGLKDLAAFLTAIGFKKEPIQ